MHKAIRSWLFVPADSERKLARAAGLDGESAADALILDLEDALSPARKAHGRAMAVDFLKTAKPQSQIWIRINPLDSPLCAADLEAVIPHAPAGIVLPKPDGPVDVEALSTRIGALERRHGLAAGKIRIMAVATETARAVTSLGLYPRTYLPRLCALSWGAEDLATDLGATTNKGADGRFAFVYQMVRAQMLIAAKASEVQAVETLYDNFRDPDGLKTRAQRAFCEGFNGMLAIHPAQVPIINARFTPDPAQIAHARAVIAAFAAKPGAGAVELEGKMLDRPHLKQAQNILALYDKQSETRD